MEIELEKLLASDGHITMDNYIVIQNFIQVEASMYDKIFPSSLEIPESFTAPSL